MVVRRLLWTLKPKASNTKSHIPITPQAPKDPTSIFNADLSINLSIYLPIYFSIYLPTYLSTYLFTYLSMSTYLAIRKHVKYPRGDPHPDHLDPRNSADEAGVGCLHTIPIV